MAANRKLLAVAVVCAAAVIGVTGCSSDSGDKDPFDGMSADKIAEKASKASKDAGSFTMKGQMKQNGETSNIEFVVAESGDCKGTMGSAKKGKAEFLSSGKFTYSKGDDKFWEASGGGATAELLKGRWVKRPNKGSKAVCNPDDMFSNKNLKKLKREDDAEVGGAKAAVLTRKKGGETTTFYVAMEGKPYFLKVVNKGSDGPGTVTFSDYGKPVDVKAPPASEVVDPEKLAAGS
ncbi:hypothetical protein AB0B50_10615 [Streptomyces sp. NPDC041068]|uniref:hypothetical protein n=1 Tax=Streptomyces sp. NPDC041068 TaxID=3155130 RepID=UPI0033F69278